MITISIGWAVAYTAAVILSSVAIGYYTAREDEEAERARSK